MTEPMREALDRAMRLHREENLTAAASIYREILRSEPLNFEALNLLGNICIRQGRSDEALAVIGRALEINPRSVEAHMNFGYALSHLDRLDEAIASFWQAAGIRPDFTEAHNSIATVSSALDRLEDAVAARQRAIETRPDSAELYNNLGAALSELGRHDEAAASYRRAVGLEPGSAELHYNLALALDSLGRPDEAVESYRRAIEIDPEYGTAHNNLGVVLSRLGQLNAAVLSYRRALELEPAAANAHNNLGVALSKLDRMDEAIVCFQQAIAIAPEFAEAHNNLANSLSKLDRLDEAIASYRRAIEISADYGEAHSNLGFAELKAQRPDLAIVSFRAAVALNPESAEGHNGLGVALSRVLQWDEALTHYRHALRLNPDYADPYNNLGTVLKTVGRVEEAREVIETAIRLAPARAEFYLNLSELRRFVDGDPYLAAMEQLAAADPPLVDEERMHLHFALGKALADAGRRQQGFRHLLAGNALKRVRVSYDETAVLRKFERARAIFTRDLMRARQGLGCPSTIPVFILGMPRSGTTLVEQILASHPQVHGAGELAAFADISARLSDAGGGEFPEVAAMMSGPQLRGIGAHYLDFVRRLAPDAARITDKMPANFRFVGLIHLALPEARIIHICRDPIDTCLSCFSLLFAGDQPHTYELGELGRYYRGYYALMDHWRRVLPPGAMLDVQYEDVVADLTTTARRIVAHCGLEWDDACLEFHRTDRPVHTASVLQVRQPIYRSSVGRWREYEDELRPLLAALGGAAAPQQS